MDGNKKIRILSIAFLFLLLAYSCRVQKTEYVSLYMDNYAVDSLVADSFDITLIDSTLQFSDDSNIVVDADSLDVSLSIDTNYLVYNDSLNKKEFKVLINNIIDSIYYLNNKIDAIQENLNNDSRDNYTSYKVKKTYYLDSIKSQNETIVQLKKQLNSKEKIVTKYDTVYITKEIPKYITKNNNTDNEEAYNKELSAKNTEIQNLKRQLSSLEEIKNRVDTVYLVKEVPKYINKSSDNGDLDAAIQELNAKNHEIAILSNQVGYLKKIKNKTDTVFVVKEISSYLVETTDTTNNQELSAENDTLNPINSTAKSTDTIINVKDSTNFNLEDTSISKAENTMELDSIYDELNSKNDTIIQLKRRIKDLEKKPIVAETRIVEVASTEKKMHKFDTLIYTAYYDRGKTTPDNKVFDKILEISKNKLIEKVVLSGYTDISGNKEINKRLTDTRLEYIYSKIKKYIPINKIYLQNFGDSFASQNVVQDERRVEIKIYFSDKKL